MMVEVLLVDSSLHSSVDQRSLVLGNSSRRVVEQEVLGVDCLHGEVSDPPVLIV